MKIVAVHGFLGLPSDWDFLRDEFEVQAIDVLREAIPDDGELLLGYSLGGRLAVQVLLHGARYRRAVLVSTRVSEAEPGRGELDERWARRFESEPWSELMRDWNAQPIFGGHDMDRCEEDFDRDALARALRELSPAVLPPIANRLREIAIPVLLVAGERDSKYVAEARRAATLLPDATVAIVTGAAHRVPWEQPAVLKALLRELSR